MTLTEYERLARRHIAEDAARWVGMRRHNAAQSEAAREERRWLGVLRSACGQQLIARIPAVQEVRKAVRRFVEARIRSRTLTLHYSPPMFTGTFHSLVKDCCRVRGLGQDAEYYLHVQFRVLVTVRRGHEKEQIDVYVEEGKGDSWQCRSNRLSAHIFARKMEQRREHTLLFKVKNRATADEAVQRIRDLATGGCVWDYEGWATQRSLAFSGVIHSRLKQKAPVRRFGRAARERLNLGYVEQPLSELLK